MEDNSCITNTTAKKARLKRKIILQHKKRLRKLKEEKAAIQKAILSKVAYTPPFSKSTHTPLGDITSSILNQNISRPESSSSFNGAKYDVIHQIQNKKEVQTRDYQVNLTKKFEAVNLNTRKSPNFNQNGNIQTTTHQSALKKSTGSRVHQPIISPNCSLQSQNSAGQFTNGVPNSIQPHQNNMEMDKSGTDTNYRNPEKHKIQAQRRLNANNFKLNLTNQFEAVNCHTQPMPQMSYVGSSSNDQNQDHNTNTPDQGVS
jgi:hypothetical protein